MTDDFEIDKEYFDSDEFLQEPFMVACAAEMNRDKTLIMNPARMAKVTRAHKLIEEIIAREALDATIDVSITPLTRKNIRMVVRTDSMSGSSRKEIDIFREVLSLCDSYLILPGNDDLLLSMTFRNVMMEIADK